MHSVWLTEDLMIIEGYTALYIKSLETIVLADIHLGYEYALATSQGYYLPKTQFEIIISDLKEIIEKTNPAEIIIVGDIKHEFGHRSWQEYREVGLLLDFLESHLEHITIIRGNHDNFIRGVFKKYTKSEFIDELLIKDRYLFTHGHLVTKDIMKNITNKTVVMGHEHPALLLTDDIGTKIKIPAFLFGPTKYKGNVVVLPATSPLMPGTEVNLITQEELLSPLLKTIAKLEELTPYGVNYKKGILPFPKIGLWKEMYR